MGPPYGKRDPYRSHIFRDSYGKLTIRGSLGPWGSLKIPVDIRSQKRSRRSKASPARPLGSKNPQNLGRFGRKVEEGGVKLRGEKKTFHLN